MAMTLKALSVLNVANEVRLTVASKHTPASNGTLTGTSTGNVSAKQSGNATLDAAITEEGVKLDRLMLVPGNQYQISLTVNDGVKDNVIDENLIVKLPEDAQFEAGKYYTVPLDVTVLSNNQAEYEDLSQTVTEETANCYIVTETGEHKFLATVIGNGEAGILPEAGFHTSSAIINPRSAGLLWSDVDGFISDVRLEAGEVHYTVNSLSGNAVIAVYSGPDRTGVILWSWHIWGTGGELPADEVITNRVGAEFTMMDRTLGAHSKTSVCATLYQWGRKDPFPNTKTYFVDGEEVDILDEFPVYQSSGTLQEGIENPGCFIRFGTENDWLAERHDALWGDEYNATSYNDASAGQGWAYGKTIYDPCPAGYRVSGSYAWTGFVNTSSSLFATKDSNIEYVKFDNGYYFKRNESDTEGTFYPMVGSRGQYGGADGGINSQGNYLAGYNAGYWKSNPAREVSGAGRAYMMEIGKYTAPGNNNSNPANNVKASYIAERRYALGVRCERIPMNN